MTFPPHRRVMKSIVCTIYDKINLLPALNSISSNRRWFVTIHVGWEAILSLLGPWVIAGQWLKGCGPNILGSFKGWEGNLDNLEPLTMDVSNLLEGFHDFMACKSSQPKQNTWFACTTLMHKFGHVSSHFLQRTVATFGPCKKPQAQRLNSVYRKFITNV